MRAFFLLFITIPILEMWVLIEVGARIGALPTIALVFLTAAIGLALLRQQGLNTLLRVDQRLAQGQLPAGEIIEGVLLAVGGALLLTPGFITDAFGFACLIPYSRRALVRYVVNQGMVQTRYGRGGTTYTHYETHSTHHSSRESPPDRAPKNSEGRVIEGECHRED